MEPPPKEVFFGAYPPDERLCVVETLKQYESRTKQYRKREGAEAEERLFLSYVKPHKPVTSQRIAHWIKDLLQDAGVDINVFKAHSARGASATAAYNKGVSMQEILQTADWSKDSTFRRFYYRPLESAEYALKVLSHKDI